MAINLNLSQFKSAGVYTLEIDNSQVTTTTVNTNRLLVGFANKGPFNRPVYLETDTDRETVFGPINTKLEHKGCFFNRMAKTLLNRGPIFALNLLKTDDSDKVNYVACSLEAPTKNYLEDATTPFASLYDRSRFWIPSSNNLTAVAASGLEDETDTASFEHSNILNFANVGTEQFSLLVYKTENLTHYDITAKEWYNGTANIPYGWIRPSDYISDYFLTVICVKGDWSDYNSLSTDPVWYQYFDKNGLIKSKINKFLGSDGVTLLGSWTGSIIPDFTDKQGNNQNLFNKVNKNTETTGLLMAFNEDAAQVLAYNHATEDSTGCWYLDMDNDSSMESDEGTTKYIVDMVGHNLYNNTSYGYVNSTTDSTNVYAYSSVSKSGVIELTAKQGRKTYDSSTPFKTVVNVKAVSDLWTVVVHQGDATGAIQSTTEHVEVADPTAGTVDTPAANAKVATTDQTTGIITVILYDAAGTAAATTTIYTPEDVQNYFMISFDASTLIDSVKADIIYTNATDKSFELTSVNKTDTDKSFANTYIADALIDASATKAAVKLTVTGTPTGATTPVTATVDSIPFNLSAVVNVENAGNNASVGINFLSYNYKYDASDGVIKKAANVTYFKDFAADASGNTPVISSNKTMIAITDKNFADNIAVGDLVVNDASNNTNLIPGLTRVIKKIFVYVDSASSTFTYKGQSYTLKNSSDLIDDSGFKNSYGFYLVTALDDVAIQDASIYLSEFTNYISIAGKKYVAIVDSTDTITGFENENGVDYTKAELQAVTLGTQTLDSMVGQVFTHISVKVPCVIRQLPISNAKISTSLRLITMNGLKISSKHRPGYDASGAVDLEGGVTKIYSVLEDEGIQRGLCNPEMVDYRYIIDSMGYGVDSELGGKVYLSRLAMNRGKCTAMLNMPSLRQFSVSENPYFCDAYVPGVNTKPAFSTKYIPEGGNDQLYATKLFSLPTEEDGSKFSAAFWPYLEYTVNGKKILVPPAADVTNTFMNKFQGGDEYAIIANMNGILSNPYLTGIEYKADTADRDYLEPFGVNTIISRNGTLVIYGNQTCYQKVISDFNKLHVRENLNTIEINCNAILQSFNFRYNTAVTRAAIVTALTPVLQAMADSGALIKYDIVCNETNNTDEIIASDYGIVDINVWFTHGMEKIVQRITVNRLSDNS